MVVWAVRLRRSACGGFLLPESRSQLPLDGRDRRHAASTCCSWSLARAADLLQRPDPLQQPVRLAGDGLPAEHAGRGRPGVRLQVPGRGRLQQLGLPAAGQPDPDRLRAGLRRRPWYFYVLLPLFFLGFVLLPGSLGALACPADRQLRAAAAQAGADRRWRRWSWSRWCWWGYRLVLSSHATPCADDARDRSTRCSSDFALRAQPAGAEPLGVAAACSAAALGELGARCTTWPWSGATACSCTWSPPGRPAGCTAAATTAWPPAAPLRAALRRRLAGSAARPAAAASLDPQTAPADRQGLPHLPPRPGSSGRRS